MDSVGAAVAHGNEVTMKRERLEWIKLSIDVGSLDQYPYSVREYAKYHGTLEGCDPRKRATAAPDCPFPQEPTTNQDFSAEQFNAYRDLGCFLVLKHLVDLGESTADPVANCGGRTKRPA